MTAQLAASGMATAGTKSRRGIPHNQSNHRMPLRSTSELWSAHVATNDGHPPPDEFATLVDQTSVGVKSNSRSTTIKVPTTTVSAQQTSGTRNRAGTCQPVRTTSDAIEPRRPAVQTALNGE